MNNQNGNGKATIDCPNCKQRFGVNLPVPEITNSLKASVIVATHEKPLKCLCGQAFIPAVAAIQTQWEVQPISPEQVAMLEGSLIIEAPKGLRVGP